MVNPSLPSRERGLKFLLCTLRSAYGMVAPFAGAWIEIKEKDRCVPVCVVAPFAGAWIEIPRPPRLLLPSAVAPFAGAWIEIYRGKTSGTHAACRSLRGSVD